MKLVNTILQLGLLLVFTSFSGFSQTGTLVKIQSSSGPIQIKKSKPSEAEAALAWSEAKKNIIKEYISKAPEETSRLLSPHQDKLTQNPDGYLSNFQIIGELVDAKAKTLNVSAFAFVDEAKVIAVVPRQAGAKNYISMVFVSRRQSSVVSDGPEVQTGVNKVKQNEKSVIQETNEGGLNTGITEKDRQGIGTFDRKITRSETREYEIAASDSLNTAIEGVMTMRKFKMVPSATLKKRSNGAFNVDKFLEAFKKGDDIDEDVVAEAAEACKAMKPQLPFYGFGTLTLEPPSKSPVSGRTTVNVQIYAKIIDCRDDFATTVASLSGVQITGEGESATEAETVALSAAAKEAAKRLADQLNEKQIF